MPRIIRNSRVEEDQWTLLPATAVSETSADTPLPAGALLLPLPLWLARRDELLARADGNALGVWLDAGDDPAAIAADLGQLALVAVNFPKFADGRGYSIARTLRERYGYAGELRAIGDVLHDQLFYLRRCGFDAFALRADKDAERALAGLKTFSDGYQGVVDTPPLFRRRPPPADAHGERQ
jgi:uncharacterized protein (DUF934 family)